MDLHLNMALAEHYTSGSQIARIITEDWTTRQMYCPRCAHPHLEHLPDGRAVRDFICPSCGSLYELKSSKRPFGKRLTSSAYGKMIECINSDQNPDFLFMHYSLETESVCDLTLIPKHFFVPDVIKRRNRLRPSAQRAGWEGSIILLDKIPLEGRISIISDGIPIDKEKVLQQVNRCSALYVQDITARGWLLDVLSCIETLPGPQFTLQDMYSFEGDLQERHPNNQNIRPKIRQQLQILRDKGIIEFLGRGIYRRT